MNFVCLINIQIKLLIIIKRNKLWYLINMLAQNNRIEYWKIHYKL